MSEKVSRRNYTKYAAAGVVVVAVGAAGAYYATRPAPSPQPTQTITRTETIQPTITPTEKPEEVTVQLTNYLYLEPGPKIWYDKVIQKYENAYPDVKVNMTPVKDWEIQDHLWRQVAAGTAPDLGTPYGASMSGVVREMALMGALEPLDDYWKKEDREKFYPVTYEGFQFDFGEGPKIFGMTEYGAQNVLWVNRNIFRSVGIDKPPETRDEFGEYVVQCTADIDGDGVIDQWGTGYENWRTYYTFSPWFSGMDGYFISYEEKEGVMEPVCTVNGPEGVDVLSWLTSFLDMKPRPIYPEFVTSYDYRNLLFSNKIALWNDGAWTIGVQENNFPDFSKDDYDAAFVPWSGKYLPNGKKLLTETPMCSIVMLNQSKHKEEAWNLMYYTHVDDDGERWYVENAGNPPVRSDWRELGVEIPGRKGEMIATHVDQLEFCRGEEPTMKPSMVSDRVAVAMQEAFTGEADPEDALNRAAEDIQKNLAYE